MAAPVQPLPEWMSRTFLPDPAASGGSRLATIVYAQTYSGPYIGDLDWPWTSEGPGSPQAAAPTLVSIIGEVGQDAFTSLGASQEATSIASPGPNRQTASVSATSTRASESPIPTRIGSSATTANSSGIAGSSTSSSVATSSDTSASGTSSSPTSTTTPLRSTNSSSSTSTSPSSPASSSGTTLPPVIDPSQYIGSSGLSKGVIAAIVLFSVALALGLLLLLIALLRRRRRKRREGSASFNGQDTENGRPDMQTRGGLVFSGVGSPEEREGLMHPGRGASGRPSEGGDGIESLDSLAVNEHSESHGSRFRHVSAATGSSHPSASTGEGSTGTRGSLIAQFPTWGRKPSDDSTGGGAGRTGGSGGGSGGNGSGGNEHSQSPATMASSDLFVAPPPRPASRTRTLATDPMFVVAAAQAGLLEAGAAASVSEGKSSDGSALGLGRPSHLARDRDLPSLPEKEGSTPATSLGSQSHASDAEKHASYPVPRAPHSTLEPPSVAGPGTFRSVSDTTGFAAGVGGWASGFGFLRPYLGGNLPIPCTPERRRPSTSGAEEADFDLGAAKEAERHNLLLPSAIPMNRKDSSYRRVTTTAAAFDTADLADLQRRAAVSQRIKPSFSPEDVLEEGSDEDEQDEGKSLVSHEAGGSSTGHETPAAVQLKSSGKRASRTTLGRPITRLSDFSGISQVSLVDARSISESIAGSIVAARNRSPGSSDKKTKSSRSRSGSHSSSAGGHTQESSGRSRGGSLSGGSGSGSGSANLSRKSTKSSTSGGRRGENSSNGSNASSGGRRSARSHRGHGDAQEEWDHLHPNMAARLRKVSEYGEITDEPARPGIQQPPLLPLPGQH